MGLSKQGLSDLTRGLSDKLWHLLNTLRDMGLMQIQENLEKENLYTFPFVSHYGIYI